MIITFHVLNWNLSLPPNYISPTFIPHFRSYFSTFYDANESCMKNYTISIVATVTSIFLTIYFTFINYIDKLVALYI